MTAPPTDARLAEVEQFLDVWDAAPVHRTQYRDVISSQKSGDPDGGRKLRATALRELLAEVRRLRGELGEALGRLATLKDALDAQALAERQRLARALADRNDEYDALKAEFDQFADVCSSHSADRCVEQVAMEDLQAAYERLGSEASRLAEAAHRFRVERDRLHDALSEVLATGGADFDGEVLRGLKRTLWITPDRLQGWRDVLASVERSERDDVRPEATP